MARPATALEARALPADSDRVAVLHGPEELLGRLSRLLGDVDVRHVASRDEVIEALGTDGTSVVLIDHARLADVGADAIGGSLPPSGRRAPVVVLRCPDAAAVEQAISGGASLAARADAGDAELLGLLRASFARDELARNRAAAEDALLRQRALVMKDDLTAAFNRRFFERYLDEEIDRARRFRNELALVFMDLDDLKEVNKRHGHAAGSAVLQEAAARVIRTIRSIDKVVRYGGDEFCILLPETGVAGAREVAERVREALAAEPFAVKQTGGVTLTASFGIAAYPAHAATKADLVRAADRAMLEIKESRKDGIGTAAGGAA